MTRKETEDLLNLYGSNLDIYRGNYSKLVDEDFGSYCRNPFVARLLRDFGIDNMELLNSKLGLEHVFIMTSNKVDYYTIFDYLDGKFSNPFGGPLNEYYFSATTLIVGQYQPWFDRALGLPSIPPSAHGCIQPMMQQVLSDIGVDTIIDEEQARQLLNVMLSKISGNTMLVAALGCPLLDNVLSMIEKDMNLEEIADNLWYKLAPGNYSIHGNIVVYGSEQRSIYDIFSAETWRGYENAS